MNTAIIALIHTFQGYSYESAGIVSGFFVTCAQAHACANQIRGLMHAEVDVCGCQMSVRLPTLASYGPASSPSAGLPLAGDPFAVVPASRY